MPQKLKLPIAVAWIFFATSAISGIPWNVYYFYQRYQQKRQNDPRYSIVAIYQTGPEKEVLDTGYLAELLDLSIDKPINIYAFSEKEAEKKLLLSPLIKKAKIKKLKPKAIYIDYTVRKPIFHLLDFENTLIDEEGFLFPKDPFFRKKLDLPSVYLGLDFTKSNLYKHRLQGKKVSLLFCFLHLIEDAKYPFTVKQIDISNAFAASFGKREIVLHIEEKEFVATKKGFCLCHFPKILRLSPKNYEKQLKNFLILRDKMLKDYKVQVQEEDIKAKTLEFSPKIIDFRIDELAFIQGEK